MRLCEQVDEWYVMRTLLSVPLRSCGAWSFALLRGLRCSVYVARCFPSCVVTSLCDSSDDFPSMA